MSRKEAEAMRTKADAARYQAEQEAAGIRARGEAEAAAIQAKGRCGSGRYGEKSRSLCEVQ